jgi:predicted phage gp36 major capsid-like protein
MAYLKTILTYHLPSEAEIDKSLLESHGITVNLLNNNEARNELGAPFHIQLQVPGEEAEEAVRVLKEFNPQRFGSAENVRKIERELGGMLIKALGVAAVAGLVFYFLRR